MGKSALCSTQRSLLTHAHLSPARSRHLITATRQYACLRLRGEEVSRSSVRVSSAMRKCAGQPSLSALALIEGGPVSRLILRAMQDSNSAILRALRRRVCRGAAHGLQDPDALLWLWRSGRHRRDAALDEWELMGEVLKRSIVEELTRWEDLKTILAILLSRSSYLHDSEQSPPPPSHASAGHEEVK